MPKDTPPFRLFPSNPARDEEREGLLHTAEIKHDEYDTEPPKQWPRRKVVSVAIVLIGLLLTGTIARNLLLPSPPRREGTTPHELFSNGTHDFKRTVLMVSIDGLRADYLDRGLTPHLLDISKHGLRAKAMIPIFPTLTFPNHWALMTGLHAESHGIVANIFWDPARNQTFIYKDSASVHDPSWWFGEPVWETTERAGVTTANLMWPGPPITVNGVKSTYFVPWKDKVPLDDKLNQILRWIDLPFEKRPQLILMYEPSLDQAGHASGPMSKPVNETLINVDGFAHKLHTQLTQRNLTEIVDIVFVSDHGMTDTSDPEHIYVEDLLGEDGLKDVAHYDGWPAMGIRWKPTANETKYYERLKQAATENPGKFEVYTRENMPERWHFSHNERISPLYIVPKIGYILTRRNVGNRGQSKGDHGYDNLERSMQAVFVAHGPFARTAKATHQRRSADLPSRGIRSPPKGWYETTDNSFIIDTFPNVEIYNLILRLLGIEEHAAPTNGTIGFWDMYL